MHLVMNSMGDYHFIPGRHIPHWLSNSTCSAATDQVHVLELAHKSRSLLVIESVDGKEILVPFVDEIVPEVNVEEGYILITPPAGLFELNDEDAGEPAE